MGYGSPHRRARSLTPLPPSANTNSTYGRIAPRSGLAWKKHIDVGAGVIDRDYTGNVGSTSLPLSHLSPLSPSNNRPTPSLLLLNNYYSGRRRSLQPRQGGPQGSCWGPRRAAGGREDRHSRCCRSRRSRGNCTRRWRLRFDGRQGLWRARGEEAEDGGSMSRDQNLRLLMLL